MFDKPKINKIRRLPDGDKILLFWVMLLATAGKCNAGEMIFITEKIPFTEEDLAGEFGFDINTIRLALKTFENFDMISVYDNGFISISGWEEHQNVDKLAELREKERLKKQRQREAKRIEAATEGCPVTVPGLSPGRPAIEEEGEGDKEKEKEIHSFTLSSEGREEEMSRRRKVLGGTLGRGVVMLSDEQMEDLLNKLSLDEFDKYVAIVADCELKGKNYTNKTHYQAILEMAEKDRRVHRRKQ
jgi:predicted phage replisome organizer